jgi:hypothetical protein
MSGSTRSSSKPPKYYYGLNERQQKNWMKNTRKMEKNEELRKKHPPFNSSFNVKVVHLHYRTTLETINELIIKAGETNKYIVDTESENNGKENEGALVQIQFIHSMGYSTVILIEVNYLPNQQSFLFGKMKELCSRIFSINNEIISWGTLEDEFKDFEQMELFDLGNVTRKTNLQFLFRNWHNGSKTHPEMERRDDRTRVISFHGFDTPGENNDINYEEEINNVNCECGHHTHYDPKGKWSLQDAVAVELN